MTDPMESLRQPVRPVRPDPAFAAALWNRLVRAVYDPIGAEMTEDIIAGAARDAVRRAARQAGPELSPYLIVADGRRALAWYADVFGARQRGEPYVMPDGGIGHAELAFGGSVLMLAEGSAAERVAAPRPDEPFSHTVHVQVDDVDGTVARARRAGARVEREPGDQPYGRIAVIVDPFGHRWLLNGPVAA